MFSRNMAGWDRIARIVVAAVLLYLSFGGIVIGGLGLAFKIVAAIFLLTGLSGWCPLYALFHVRTLKSG